MRAAWSFRIIASISCIRQAKIQGCGTCRRIHKCICWMNCTLNSKMHYSSSANPCIWLSFLTIDSYSSCLSRDDSSLALKGFLPEASSSVLHLPCPPGCTLPSSSLQPSPHTLPLDLISRYRLSWTARDLLYVVYPANFSRSLSFKRFNESRETYDANSSKNLRRTYWHKGGDAGHAFDADLKTLPKHFGKYTSHCARQLLDKPLSKAL